MKVINQSELEVLVAAISAWTGAFVQKIFSSEQEYGLGLWTKDGLKWLWISLEKSLPIILPLTELPPRISKKTTPVGLFLNAHIKGKILENVRVHQELGRVITLMFGGNAIEVRLFSQGANLLVFADDKKISFDKVKEVTLAQQNLVLSPSRSAEQIAIEWLQNKSAPQHSGGQLRNDKKPSFQKKQEAILKIKKDISAKQKKPWREAGVWLKTYRSNEVPAEFIGLIDSKKSWTLNMANCFGEAKKNDEKVKKAQMRIDKLSGEIER